MKVFFQRALYNSAMLLAPAVTIPPFLFFKRGRAQITDRLGNWNLSLDKSIWMHGASLGEMVGLSNIAERIKISNPDLPIVASATSPTGLTKAKDFAIATKLLPFDHKIYFEKCVSSISPKAFIFGETEIWPNLLKYLHSRNIPSFLVNGRISEKSFNRYLYFQEIIAESLQYITQIFAVTEQDRERFTKLGANSEKVSLISNTKYDLHLENTLTERAKLNLHRNLFKQLLPIVVLSSLRPGEETIIFEAIRELEQSGKHLNYIIAARHTEKFSFFENRLKEYGFDFAKRSSLKEASEKRFLFLDTIGELKTLLVAADLVFVGGTFVDYGGHNPLEAALCGVAPLVGPYHSNVKYVVEVLRKNSALFEASSSLQIHEILAKLETNVDEVRIVGHAALKAAQTFFGGSEEICKVIGILK